MTELWSKRCQPIRGRHSIILLPVLSRTSWVVRIVVIYTRTKFGNDSSKDGRDIRQWRNPRWRLVRHLGFSKWRYETTHVEITITLDHPKKLVLIGQCVFEIQQILSIEHLSLNCLSNPIFGNFGDPNPEFVVFFRPDPQKAHPWVE